MKTTIGGDTIKLSVSKIIETTFGIIVIMLLSRITTLEEYGTYSQITLIINLGISLLLFGLPNSVNYFLAQAEEINEKQKFLSVYYTLITLLSIILGFLLVFSTPLLTNFFNNISIKNYMFVLIILPWAKVINNSVENVLVVLNNTKILLIYRVIHSIAIVFTVYLAYYLDYSLYSYFKIFIGVESLFAVVVYVLVNNNVKSMRFWVDKNLIKKIFSFSVPIGIASLIGTINIQFDKIIISKLLGTESLAIYSNASREMPVNMIAVSLTAILMPRIVQLVKEKKMTYANKIWQESVIISYYIICFFVIIFIVFAPDIVTLLYTEKYLEGVEVFRIYSLVLLTRTTYFGMILNSLGKTKFIMYSSIFAMITNIIFNFLFIKIFGFSGPAIATLLSLLMMSLMQLYATSRVTKIKFTNVFPWKPLAKISILNFLLGVLMLSCKSILTSFGNFNSIFESIVISVVFGIIYLFILRKSFYNHWNILNSRDEEESR